MSRSLASFALSIFGAATVAVVIVAAQAERPPAQSPNRTRVVLLGTGTPNADPDRWGPAVAIVVDDQAYLIDAGVGVVRHAAATGIPALRAQGLQRVFLTHLHSDHTLGLPDLMLSPWVANRPVPLQLYGPPGTADMAKHIEEAWRQDIDMRLFGGEGQKTRNYRAIAHEVAAGRIYEDDKVKIDAIAVPHGTWPEAFGYRIQTVDRLIVISGDTRPSTTLPDACNGCDLFMHEVYSAARRPLARQAYSEAYHTSTVELAEIAGKARPRLLVLYHQLFYGASDADLEAEIKKAGYAGRVISGKDMDVY